MLDTNSSNLCLMELILIWARTRRFKFLCRKLLKHSLKEMLSKEPEDLRFSSLTTGGVSPIMLLSCLISEWLCVSFSQLKKPFKYLTKLSRNLLEPFMFKCNLLLLRFFLGSIN